MDHHDDLVQERTRIQNRLRWHLHDLEPQLEVPIGALDRLERFLAVREQGAQVRIAAELVARCHELTKRAKQLERELQALVEQEAAALLELSGCGVLTAAKLVAEAAGVHASAATASSQSTGARPPCPPPPARSSATVSTARVTGN